MIIRMFEYDSQIALDDGEIVNGRLIVTFPHSAVIFLRHTSNTPDSMTVEISTPGGNISYEIPVMKTQMYTIDEIFDRDLLFLIPFHIFCYEYGLDDFENDEEKLRELQDKFAEIRGRLERLCIAGRISEFTKCTLLDMSRKVIENLAAKYANVRKGVTSVMGGKVLEYEAKTILRDGFRQGEKAGKAEGERSGILKTYISLVKDGLLSISDASVRLGITEEEFKKKL